MAPTPSSGYTRAAEDPVARQMITQHMDVTSRQFDLLRQEVAETKAMVQGVRNDCYGRMKELDDAMERLSSSMGSRMNWLIGIAFAILVAIVVNMLTHSMHL